MVRHFRVREFIDRNGVAIATSRRLRDRPGIRWREGLRYQPANHRVAGAFRPGRMSIAPDVITEIDDVAIRIQPAANFGKHGRTVRLPNMLLVSHPLQTHRRSGERYG